MAPSCPPARVPPPPVRQRNGTARAYLTVPFHKCGYTDFNVAQDQATGVEPTSFAASDARPGTGLKDLSAGVGVRRRGACETIAGNAPEGVGSSAASRFSSLRPRKARNAKKHVQARSTPRSVQEKIICGDGMVADGFMGTSFLYVIKSFSEGCYYRDSKQAPGLHIFGFAIIILDEQRQPSISGVAPLGTIVL